MFKQALRLYTGGFIYILIHLIEHNLIERMRIKIMFNLFGNGEGADAKCGAQVRGRGECGDGEMEETGA